jgi:ATP-binding cassette subfamily B (MDR/TAP) protein 6
LAVIITFITDALVFIIRALADRDWTSSVLVYYIFVSLLSWIFFGFLLADETSKFKQWSWIQYTFWIEAFVLESLVAWLWVVAIVKPRDGNGLQKLTYINIDM